MLTSCSLGEVCSHIADLLFKVEAANRMGYTQPSRMSLPCHCNRSFKTGVNLIGITDVSSYFIFILCDRSSKKKCRASVM